MEMRSTITVRNVRYRSWMGKGLRKRFAIKKWVPRAKVRVRETIWQCGEGPAAFFFPLHLFPWEQLEKKGSGTP